MSFALTRSLRSLGSGEFDGASAVRPSRTTSALSVVGRHPVGAPPAPSAAGDITGRFG